MRPAMIAVVDAVKTYEGKRRVTALDGVSFTVAAGEMVAVMGPIGVGKVDTSPPAWRARSSEFGLGPARRHGADRVGRRRADAGPA